MLACQMSQSEEGMARMFFYNRGYNLLLFYTVNKICIAIELERTLYEYVGGLH